MAKNTFSNTFRKLDVDQFNEDNFKDDDGPQVEKKGGPGGGPSAAEVETLIQSGRNAEALKSLLSSAPIGTKDQAEKVIISGQTYLNLHMNSCACLIYLYVCRALIMTLKIGEIIAGCGAGVGDEGLAGHETEPGGGERQAVGQRSGRHPHEVHL